MYIMYKIKRFEKAINAFSIGALLFLLYIMKTREVISSQLMAFGSILLTFKLYDLSNLNHTLKMLVIALGAAFVPPLLWLWSLYETVRLTPRGGEQDSGSDHIDQHISSDVSEFPRNILVEVDDSLMAVLLTKTGPRVYQNWNPRLKGETNDEYMRRIHKARELARVEWIQRIQGGNHDK